jgi:tRNA threonylcarbamoyladenosine biosynthesis protein TsaB
MGTACGGGVTSVLALESATGAVGAAVAVDGIVVAELTVRTARRHVELLHPAIEEVCRLAGVALSDLDAVAADVGPGLFTGIRVGVAAAKAIAFGRGIPAVGVTSLDALRAAAVDAGAPEEAVVPVVDLRRGEVAWSYRGNMGWGPPAVLLADLEADAPSGEGDRPGVAFVGDGALRYAGELVDGRGRRTAWRVAGTSLASPPVASVAVLAAAALADGRGVDAAHLAPRYLREADARINWTTRHDGGRGGAPK